MRRCDGLARLRRLHEIAEHMTFKTSWRTFPCVILGYADDATHDIHVGVDSRAARRFSAPVRVVARRKLDLLGAAGDVRDLAVPPGNRLEKLKGDLAGFHSIRVNDQFRIIFKFEAGNASAVQIVDDH
jgi:proteic killer suppression protein